MAAVVDAVAAVDLALSVYSIAMTIFGFATQEKEEKSRLETLAENTAAWVHAKDPNRTVAWMAISCLWKQLIQKLKHRISIH